MADIVSRIKLEAEGGDRAAQEISKVKSAYQEAAEASEQMSGSTQSGGDPFKQATSRTQSDISKQVSQADQRQESLHKQLQRGQDREMQTRRMGRGLQQGMGTASSATQQLASGDAPGAASTIMGGVGKMGLGLGIGAAVFGTANQLAQNEMQRVQGLYGAGLPQQLGRTYSETESMRYNMSLLGMGTDRATQFLQSVVGAGGSIQTMTGRQGNLLSPDQGRTNRVIEAMMATGADTGTMGRFAGLSNLLGLTTVGEGAGPFGVASEQFGRQNVGRFTEALSQITEQMLSAGQSMEDITSGHLERATEFMGAAGQFGGMDIRGATQLEQQTRQRGRQAGNLGQPMDILLAQQMRGSEESITDVMLRMQQNPREVSQQAFRTIQGMSGGNRDIARIMAQRYLGGDIQSAEQFLQTERAIAEERDVDQQTMEQLREGTRAERETIARRTGAEPGDVQAFGQDPVRELVAAENIRVLRGPEKFLADVRGTLQQFLTGELGDLNAINRLTPTGMSEGRAGGEEPTVSQDVLRSRQEMYQRILYNVQSGMDVSGIGYNPRENDVSNLKDTLVNRLQESGTTRRQLREAGFTDMMDPSMRELLEATQSIAEILRGEVNNRTTTDSD